MKATNTRKSSSNGAAIQINFNAKEVKRFMRYVWDYYTTTVNPETLEKEPALWGLWKHDSKPITRAEIRWATKLLLEHYILAAISHPLGFPYKPAFDGGSHDREIVKDLILVKRGVITVNEAEHGKVVAPMLEEVGSHG